MNEPFRPSTVGEILDRTASLYRSRFLVFFGLAAIPAAVMLALSGGALLLFAWAGMTANASGTPRPEAIGGMVVGLMLLFLLALPLTIGANAMCGAALCQAAGVHALGGSITIASALKAVWKRGWHYIGLYVLEMLIIFGIPFGLWTVLIMIASFGMAVTVGAGAGGAGVLLSGVLIALLFVGVAVYVVWMLLQLCLAFPIAVIEKAAIGASLKRAWQLCRGTRLRMLLMFMLMIALGWVASLVLTVPLFIVIALVPGLNSPQHAEVLGTVMMIGVYGMSFAVQAFTLPVFAISLVLFYYDQRVRKEGFDVELLMERAGMMPEPVAQPELRPWMPEPRRGTEQSLETGAELNREPNPVPGPESAEVAEHGAEPAPERSDASGDTQTPAAGKPA